jgi:hypothetical protein
MLGPHQLLPRQCQYIRGQSEAKIELSSLKVAGRHLAGLRVALEIVAKLLAFNDFAHSGALNSGDVNERICAAIVRLNEAEAFSGIKPFYCAGGHEKPFQSIEKISAKLGLAEGDGDLF